MSAGDAESAEHHKLEGNTAFRTGAWGKAILSYTKALNANREEWEQTVSAGDEAKISELKKQRVILYSNRAVSYIQSYRYDQGLFDADCAFTLDPTFHKALSRKAEAHAHLIEHDKAISYYEEAIRIATGRDQAAVDRYKKAQTDAQNVKKAIALLRSRSHLKFATPGDSPYNRYKKLKDKCRSEAEVRELEERKLAAALMAEAYEMCTEGLKELDKFKLNPDGSAESQPELAIREIAESIILDRGGFHISDKVTNHSDIKEFFSKINHQIIFDAHFNGWSDFLDGKPDPKTGRTRHYTSPEILDVLDARVKTEKDWQGARRALASIVRSDLCQGFMAEFSGDFLKGIDPYARIIDLMSTATKRWANVSNDDRGNIFQNTFLRKVKVNYLSLLQKIYANKRLNKLADGTQVTLTQITDLAEDIINECATNQWSGHPVMHYGYQRLAIFNAATALGYSLGEKARQKENRTCKGGVAWFYNKEMCLAAAKMYSSVEVLASDDPGRGSALALILMYQLRAGAALTLTQLYERAAEIERAYSAGEEIYGTNDERYGEPREVIRTTCDAARASVQQGMKEPFFDDYGERDKTELAAVPDLPQSLLKPGVPLDSYDWLERGLKMETAFLTLPGDLGFDGL